MKKKYKSNIDKNNEEYENPIHYEIKHEVAEETWKYLYESGNIDLAEEFSKFMIRQGCEGIKSEDVKMIINFWKNYLNEKVIFSNFTDKEEKLN